MGALGNDQAITSLKKATKGYNNTENRGGNYQVYKIGFRHPASQSLFWPLLASSRLIEMSSSRSRRPLKHAYFAGIFSYKGLYPDPTNL